jgi:hypothetical protein
MPKHENKETAAPKVKAVEVEKTKPAVKVKTAKRITVEIAPGVRELLEAHIAAFNDQPERSAPVLKYTDVVNHALDAYLPKLPASASS